MSFKVRADGSLLGDKREFIAERDGGWFCHYCDQALANWNAGEHPGCVRNWRGHEHPNGLCVSELDHVHAESRGGSGKVENLVLACSPCNLAKRALTYLEFITGWREVA